MGLVLCPLLEVLNLYSREQYILNLFGDRRLALLPLHYADCLQRHSYASPPPFILSRDLGVSLVVGRRVLYYEISQSLGFNSRAGFVFQTILGEFHCPLDYPSRSSRAPEYTSQRLFSQHLHQVRLELGHQSPHSSYQGEDYLLQ